MADPPLGEGCEDRHTVQEQTLSDHRDQKLSPGVVVLYAIVIGGFLYVGLFAAIVCDELYNGRRLWELCASPFPVQTTQSVQHALEVIYAPLIWLVRRALGV